jgi:hypothetical protein
MVASRQIDIAVGLVEYLCVHELSWSKIVDPLELVSSYTTPRRKSTPLIIAVQPPDGIFFGYRDESFLLGESTIHCSVGVLPAHGAE